METNSSMAVNQIHIFFWGNQKIHDKLIRGSDQFTKDLPQIKKGPKILKKWGISLEENGNKRRWMFFF